MDHHRAQVAEIRVRLLDLVHDAQQLRRSRIAVAVHKRLHAALIGSLERLPQGIVLHCRITTIAVLRIFIGLPQPCGARLRRTVEEQLASS